MEVVGVGWHQVVSFTMVRHEHVTSRLYSRCYMYMLRERMVVKDLGNSVGIIEGKHYSGESETVVASMNSIKMSYLLLPCRGCGLRASQQVCLPSNPNAETITWGEQGRKSSLKPSGAARIPAMGDSAILCRTLFVAFLCAAPSITTGPQRCKAESSSEILICRVLQPFKRGQAVHLATINLETPYIFSATQAHQFWT